MFPRFKRWWIDDVFGPRSKGMFLLRIRARVRKLRFLLWWRRPKARKILHYSPKPLALLFIGIVVPILVALLLRYSFSIKPTAIFSAFRDLLGESGKRRLEWRDATQLLIILIGVPAGFLLWLFRDMNVSGTLENQRKDVNLKEFQEIQIRAAGAMDEKFPALARETLQIAALHQLRAFLRGEYGNSFRRPAFELLRARLVGSEEAGGTQSVENWLVKWRLKLDIRPAYRLKSIQTMREIVGELKRGPFGPVAKTEVEIIHEEWQAIFRPAVPLTGARFDKIEIPGGAVLASVKMVECRFLGARLAKVHLEEADLTRANFAGADLSESYLEAACLEGARFEGSDLTGAHLERASLRHAQAEGAILYNTSLQKADLAHAKLDGADLRFANLNEGSLRGASLIGANLTGADLLSTNLRDAVLAHAYLPTVDVRKLERCDGASFDDETEFAEDWSRLDAANKDGARAAWVERGAIRIE